MKHSEVEMQSSAQKLVLADLRSQALQPGQSIQARVDFHIKQPGPRQYRALRSISVRSLTLALPCYLDALQCAVGYAKDGHSNSFRKVYKFTGTPPFSVRTKVHTPRAVTTAFTASRNTTYRASVSRTTDSREAKPMSQSKYNFKTPLKCQ